MNKATQLWHATETGKYPRGTKVKDLTEVANGHGTTALHIAAYNGTLPPNTTVTHLAQCKNDYGTSALHSAAAHGHLPPRTTAAQLAACKDTEGRSALHNAASIGKLPSDTTAHLLKSTYDNNNLSAWETLLRHTNNYPENLPNLNAALFHTDHETAINFANKAIKDDPNAQATIAIWLGRVLAANVPTHQPSAVRK